MTTVKTYRKRPTATVDQVWKALNAQPLGMHIAKRDIRVRGRWALVRTRQYDDINLLSGKPIKRSQEYHDDVDCYNLSSRASCFEVWDEIKYEDSPFIPFNEERTEKALTRLEQDEDFPLEGECLIALEGDMAKGGMGDSNYVYPIEPEHNSLVKAFLEAQLAFRMACHFEDKAGNNDRELMSKLCQVEYEAGCALREAGVFRNKYDLRTTWELAHMSDLEEFERYQPFVVLQPGEGED